jgi:F-type H+-transporting ATPase subunit delta
VIALGGKSRQSLASLRGTLDEQLKGVSSADCTAISHDLFLVLASLNSSIGLRRAFTDPSRDAASKSALIADLFEKSVSKSTIALLEAAVSLRWSSPVDVASAVEQLAIESEATAANADNTLDRLQEELFAFETLLEQNTDLRGAVSINNVEAAHKSELLSALLGNKVAPSTLRLVTELVNALNGRNIELVIDLYIQCVAARRNRAIAVVRSRSELSTAQTEKLVALLTKQMGQPVHLNVEIDPTVLGGLSIRFKDEMIDGTISTRVAEAGRALAV